MSSAVPTHIVVRAVIALGLLALIWQGLYGSDNIAKGYLYIYGKALGDAPAAPHGDDPGRGAVLGAGNDSGPAGALRPASEAAPVPVPVPQVLDLQRPPNVRQIMGLVFYGRRGTVSILDCYLKRNLARNGGALDGVIFLVRTVYPADVAFLEKLLAGEPDYYRWEVDITKGYPAAYDNIEDDVLYVKMDDDIVFIEDSAIPSIVHTKMTRPDLYAVIANVVNQPLTSWLHWNLGVVKPYLPELNTTYPEPEPGRRLDWRVSELPAWEGPDGFVVENWEPGTIKHRWLPRKGRTDHVLDNTPIQKTQYNPDGVGWSRWQIGAQQHYSLLENLEKNEMWRYRFHTWDFQYLRMGIQFIAIMGSDINLAKPIGRDDEWHFAVTMTKALGRHAVADGRGVAAHYSFAAQYSGMSQTDILDRYRAYAQENVCAGPMLWTPEEERQ